MNKLKVLHSPKEEMIKDAKGILNEAIEEGFETVLVVGIKDGQVYFRCSGCLNTHEKLGLIESAKFDWMNSWG
jgi:hypothetical protein